MRWKSTLVTTGAVPATMGVGRQDARPGLATGSGTRRLAGDTTKEERLMQHERTVSQRMRSGVRRLPAAVRRGGGIGVLAGLLLLPLSVGAVGSGDLDPSFGDAGTVLTDFGSGSNDYVNALVIQTDGKIVVAGSSDGAFALARYLPNGALDPSFGSNGTVLTDFGFGSGSEDYPSALALQPDGKIVVAGYSIAGGSHDFALARYLSNGTLDPSFSGDGTVLTNFGSGSTDLAYALVIQTDGKIVVAGSSDGAFALARYLPNGALDPSFGSNGTVTTAFDSSVNAAATDLALQPDGKIVVAGYSDGSGSYDFALARYLPTGALDPSFSGDGKVTTAFGSSTYDIATDLALQLDGKIVVTGFSGPSPASDTQAFALARYLPNGALDISFSGDGKVTTSFASGSYDGALALAIQPNGKIVVAGYSGANGISSDITFALARYLPNGALDISFNGDGTVSGIYGEARALAIQPHDGRLVVAGASRGDFTLARYHAITCNEEEESSTAWQNVAFASQAQTFTALFNAVPHQLRMDGVTGLALGPADAYTDLGAIVRFNPAGFLDARNGSVYQAARAIPYTTGLPYQVRMVVNVPQHTYSVSVTPDGGTEQTLATNYAFRTEQRTVPQLDTWALRAESGSHTVCNFALGTSSDAAWQNRAFASQARTFTARFDAVPHQNRMDGVTGLALGPADAYTDLGAIVRFNPAGFLDARNGSVYQAAQAIPYTAGTRYHLRLVVNVPQHTYSVSVTPEGGAEQVLATNYAFRTEQRTVPQLDTWALRAESGSHTVSNFLLE